jgi:hypothetical protein
MLHKVSKPHEHLRIHVDRPLKAKHQHFNNLLNNANKNAKQQLKGLVTANKILATKPLLQLKPHHPDLNNRINQQQIKVLQNKR